MDPSPRLTQPVVAVNIIAAILVVAALKTAQALVVPMLLAAFLAILGLRPVTWLEARRVPSVLAVVLVAGGTMVGLGLLAVVLGTSISAFMDRLPVYQERIAQLLTDVSRLAGGAGAPVSVRDVLGSVDPGMAMRLAGSLLTELSGAFANTFLILFTMFFILLEASSFPVKLRAVVADSEATFRGFERFTDNLNHYVVLKTGISLATGLGVTVWLAAVGVDFPVLWGVLAFLLNYVPNIGSVLAAVPAVLLGLIQFGGGWAAVVAAGYVVINFLVGSIVEPRLMGRGLDLSTLVVFLSLVVWGWVFGPVGMLLSVPLTMTMKIALESRADTRWVAVLLGSGAPAEREELPKS